MAFVDESKASEPTLQDELPRPSARDRAWLDDRLRRGKRDCFSEIVTVTPTMAAAFLELNENNHKHNRRYSQVRASKYAAIIRDGRWKATHQGIAFDKDGRLIDGQHRCGGIILANTPVKVMVSFGWDAENFALIDTGANRSAQDLLYIDGMPNGTIRAAVAKAIIWDANSNSIRPPDRHAILLKARELDNPEMEYAVRMGQNIGGAKRIGTPSSVALALYLIGTKSKHKDRLGEFVDALMSGANLSTSSPILKLRDNIAHIVRMANSGSSRITKPCGAIVIAWNAWIEKKRAGSLNWPHYVKLPEPI